MDNTESVSDPILFVKVLQEKVNLARERLDVLHQQLYNGKRSSDEYKVMGHECDEELENLVLEVNTVETKQALLKITKQNKFIAVDTLKNRLSLLDEEYSQYEESSSTEVSRLKKIIAVTNLSSSNGNSLDLSKKLNKEKLKEEIQSFKEEILLKQQQTCDQFVEIDNLNKKIQEVSVILGEYQPDIESDKQELQRINEEIMEVKDEVVLLENQVSLMNAKPLDEKARGNGLFGEIDDRGSLLKGKMKQLLKAYKEHMQLVARSHSQLKRLRIHSLNKIEENKNVEDPMLKQEEFDLISEIENMENKTECVEAEICDVPCIVDPEETEANASYIKHLINKPSQLAKDKRKELLQSKKNIFEMGKDFHSKSLELIKLRNSLALEESKHANLVELIKNDKDSESKFEVSDETIEKGSNGDLSIKLANINAKPSAHVRFSADVEDPKPKKEKMKPQLNFVITKKVNLDDL